MVGPEAASRGMHAMCSWTPSELKAFCHARVYRPVFPNNARPSQGEASWELLAGWAFRRREIFLTRHSRPSSSLPDVQHPQTAILIASRCFEGMLESMETWSGDAVGNTAFSMGRALK